jgi:hypothetical protein
MAASTDPEGGRVTLDLVSIDDAAARYRATITVGGLFPHSTVTEATIAMADGAVAFGPWSPAEPPPYLVEYARQFLRAAWRARATTPWPQRIHRWRAPR